LNLDGGLGKLRDNPVREKSYEFALRIVGLYRRMIAKREYVLARQVLKAGTSIGANVEEALAGQSRRDFLAKMGIASKEARECQYWLRLLRDSGFRPTTRNNALDRGLRRTDPDAHLHRKTTSGQS
jgi:four helix bundle protein